MDVKKMVLNDQGGECMDVSYDVTGTIRADMGNHQPIVLDDPFVIDRAAYNQGQNAKYEPFIARSQVAPPLLATGPAAVGVPSDDVKVYGNGGNPACNQVGMMICELYRKDGHAHNAEEGQGWSAADAADTLNASDISEARQSMLVTQPYTVGNGQGHQLYLQETAGTLDCMHDQQIVLYEMQHAADVISDNIGIAPTLQHRMGTGGNQVPFTVENTEQQYTVRRLTPIECARLQGFPDDWCADVPHADSAEYKMWGNGMALPCSLYIMEGIAELFEESKEN